MEKILEIDGKVMIPVPAGIRYIGEWSDFNFMNFEAGGVSAYIIDKQIPGCGFTEYCLMCNDNLILASPRRILLKNKESQHLGEVFYAKNEFEEDRLLIDKDITKISKVDLNAEDAELFREENYEALKNMENSLLEYCQKRYVEKKPIKIIVTYDSFKHVKRFLMENNLLPLFRIVVDEFQSIFVDSRFKASTEFEFLEELKKLFNPICFVSATPMMDKYLKQLNYFKDILYYRLDWGIRDPGRIMKPELKVRKIKSVNSEIRRIIQEYLDGNYAVLANPITGLPVQSTEAVFYVNSVNNILSVIKSMSLTPDQCNILCSNTPVNQKKLKKRLGVRFKIGDVPLKGEQHKMFTFCTRTVYLGADFYSTCARTFVLSDANIDSLAVDISLDLPQILGRQRLIENPWKNHAEFYFKNLGKGKELTKADFDNRIKEKLESTSDKLSLYSKGNMSEQKTIIRDYRIIISSINYMNDYVSVNYDGAAFLPVMNNLVLIAEQRAYDIQQIDYKDRFTVFSTLKKGDSIKLDKIANYVEHFRDTSIILAIRIKELCETPELTDEEKKIVAQQTSEDFDKYYNLLGPVRCKALGYKAARIKKEIKDMLVSKDDIRAKFLEVFNVGKRYSNKDIKTLVGNIYTELGLSSKKPKGSDIAEYFEIKPVLIIKDDRKINGQEILAIK